MPQPKPPRPPSRRSSLPPPTASEAAFERLLAAFPSERAPEPLLPEMRPAGKASRTSAAGKAARAPAAGKAAPAPAAGEATPAPPGGDAPLPLARGLDAGAILDDLFARREELLAREPFARIGEDFIVGYNPEAYARLLGLE